LSVIINDGIEKQAAFIELGQTAETPKMRLGGIPTPLYLEAHHSNGVLNFLVRLFSPMLEYRRKLEDAHPLKEI
jgi:hypothetical protein